MKPQKVLVACPKCGHSQQEPPAAYSTVCKNCRQHFRLDEVLPAAPNHAPAKPVASPSGISAPAPGPEPRRQLKRVICFQCGTELEVPPSAQSTMCKRCSAHVDLQDYRITAKGIARRDGSVWQMLPGKSAGAEQNRLFLAVLQGDSSGLQRDFELSLSGDAQNWKLTLMPRSMLLKQVFSQINITGAELVHSIELLETQGDSTLLRMQDSTGTQPLSDAEQHDFAE